MIETRSVHEQLIQLCQEQLVRGHWAPGVRFPSERELAAEHGLSRATANKVLAKLVSEGWLEMRKGIGCFVAERPTLFASLRRIESFTDFTREQGHRPSTRVLDFEPRCKLPEQIRVALELDSSTPVTFVRRLRLLDDQPVILEERWLPSSLYPRLTARRMEGSFYQLCREHYGLEVQKEQAEVRAVMPPVTQEIRWTCPALKIEGTGCGNDGRPIWYQILHYHGERFALQNIAENAAALPQLHLHFT